MVDGHLKVASVQFRHTQQVVVHALGRADGGAFQPLLTDVQVESRSIGDFRVRAAGQPFEDLFGFCVLLLLKVPGGNLEVLDGVEVLNIHAALIQFAAGSEMRLEAVALPCSLPRPVGPVCSSGGTLSTSAGIQHDPSPSFRCKSFHMLLL